MTCLKLFLTILLVAALSSISLADGSKHSHGEKTISSDDHTSVFPGSSLEMKTKTIKGISGIIHIQALTQIKKEAEKLFTHKISVTFTNAATGNSIADGLVALRFTKDHDEPGHFLNMLSNGKDFTTHLFLPEKGEQHMMIAATLNNEDVRQYHFHFVVK